MKVDLNDEDVTTITGLIDANISVVISTASDDETDDERREKLASLFRTREKIAPLASTPKEAKKTSGRGSRKRGLPSDNGAGEPTANGIGA